LVGAYRVGKGNEIIEQYGLKGFYIRTLFKTNEKAIPLLYQSLELGRSFIVSQYQRQPLSLFLLWKGILYFLLKNPEYRYLIGPVSISNQYSEFSKSMIVKFMTDNFFNHEIAAYFKPRKSLKPKISKQMKTLLDNTQNNLNRLDDIIGDVELNHYKMPVLLKKYLKINARLLAFNIDPLFNNCLDGLILLDLYEVPQQFIQSLSKEIKRRTVLSRLNKN
jgi:hypothetical protein